jgi:RHS repeat-associated protein
VDWPALDMRRTYLRVGGNKMWAGPSSWMGSLIQSSQGQGGLVYRRNRYYDPETGRFTQEDPIGLAGGINVYGFANADPVSYSDPLGLSPCPELPCRSEDDPMGDRPLPPGVDEKDVTWDAEHGWYVDDKDGRIIRPHGEDARHWDHWEIYPGQNGRPTGPPVDFPEQKLKPWPGQKVPPYGKQSPTDPWNEIPGAQMFMWNYRFHTGIGETERFLRHVLEGVVEGFSQVDPKMLIPSPFGTPLPAVP